MKRKILFCSACARYVVRKKIRLLLLLLFVTIASATAQTVLYVDANNGNDGNTGNSWGTAYKTLAKAMTVMGSNNSVDSILVAEGTYYPTGVQSGSDRDSAFTILRGGIKLLGGYPAGGGTRDPAAHPVYLDGDIGAAGDNSDNSYHVMVIAGIGAAADSIIVDGFTLRNGNANSGIGKYYNGIAVYQSYGGGAVVFFSNNSNRLKFHNCIFSGNNASYGGGMYVLNSEALIINITFSGNKATGGGGGMYIIHSSPAISNTTFSGNNASYGGGGMVIVTSSATISNSTFSGNSTSSGGGIFITSSSSTISNTTFSGNKANSGGGIFVSSSSANLKNCIVHSNSSGVHTAAGTAPAITYSIVQGGYPGIGNVDVDPLLVNAPNFTTAPFTGGDYRLQPASPAINAGDPATTNTQAGYTDLNGNTRIVDNRIDMGAYEVQSPSHILYVDATSGDDSYAGNSWARAHKTLARAMTVMGSNNSVDSILVAEGLYYPTGAQNSTNRDSAFTILRGGIKLLGGYPAGGGSRNPAAHPVYLDGNIGAMGSNADNSYHVMVIAGIDAAADSIIVDGFTLRNGNATGNMVRSYNWISVHQSYGGGAIVSNSNNSNRLKFHNCIFSRNNANNNGGGVAVYYSSPTISNTTFSGNSAGSGGGMYMFSSLPPINNTTFSGNYASFGGGIQIINSSPTISNTIFSGNNAIYDGGGMIIYNSSSTISNTTFSGNNAHWGGGMYIFFSYAELKNCIVQGNSSGVDTEAGTPPVITYSIVPGGYPGIGNVDVAPLFVNAPDFSAAPFTGGDYRLQPASPAINAGDPATTNVEAGYTDLDGNDRIVDNRVDMGAYESPLHLQTITFTDITTVYGNPDFNPGATTSSALPVTYTIADNTIASIINGQLHILKAGSTTITAHQAGDGTYAPAQDVTVTLVVNPLAITITADAKTKVYGDADPVLTYTHSPALVSADAFSGTLSRAAGENVGLYAINQGTLALNSNYAITYNSDNITITLKAITVTADAKTKIYGDADPVLTYTHSPALVSADAFSGTLSRAAGENVGLYAINQGTLALNSNYAITYNSDNITITLKAITVTADAKTKVYGDADPALTYTFSPALVGADVFSGALNRAAGENTGNYIIEKNTLAVNNNYQLNYVPANLVINKALLAATAGDKTVCLGDAVGTVPLSYTGFKNGDNDAAFSSQPTVNIPSYNAAGNYSLIPSGGAAANYSFSYVNGQLTVLPSPAGVIMQSPTGAGVAAGYQLTAPSGSGYTWSTGHTTGSITVRASGDYSVKVVNLQGCSNNFTVQIKLQTLSIPNTFSPNGDGINDYWLVPELRNYANAYVTIVDRDGQVVFESRSFTRWDGKNRGSDLPAGVYFYRIRKAPGEEPVSGWLNLLK